MYHKVRFLLLILCLTATSNLHTEASTPNPTPASYFPTTTPTIPLPTRFSYSCDVNGNLTVNQTEIKPYKMKLLENSATCKLTENRDDYNIHGCGKNKSVRVVLEKKHTANIIGGNTIREFQLMCEDSTEPYMVNATLTGLSVSEPTTYTALPSVAPPITKAHLEMNIYESASSNKTLTSAIIGQQMFLKISSNDSGKIDPVKCYAEDKQNVYMFWNETNCEDDPTLVGHKWEKDNSYDNSVSIILYAFHFETSHDVGLWCSVRVCTHADPKKACSLECNKPDTRRKRSAALTKDIKTIDVRANIHVIDTELMTGSAKGTAVNVVYVLIAVAFVNLHMW